MNDGTGTFSSAGNLQADGVDINAVNAHLEFKDFDEDDDLDLFIGEYSGSIFSSVKGFLRPMLRKTII